MIKIQLWSNTKETEFAIKLATDKIGFRASTNESADYVKLADEILEPDGQHIDFPFMLEKWILAWKEGFRHSAASYEWRPQESMHRETGDFSSIFPDGDNNGKSGKPSSKRLLLKCDFCNLTFYYETERLAHEREWHQDKLKARR